MQLFLAGELRSYELLSFLMKFVLSFVLLKFVCKEETFKIIFGVVFCSAVPVVPMGRASFGAMHFVIEGLTQCPGMLDKQVMWRDKT